MANELKHKDVGGSLDRTEWEAVDTHIADGQTTGDTLYFNGTYWIRRPLNTQNTTTQTGSTYAVVSSDYYVVCNNGTAITVSLPAATGSGRMINIKNIGAGNATIDGNSSDTIDGDLTQTLYQWEGFEVVDYASNKWVVL